MVDTINFKITKEDVVGCDFINEITPYLDTEPEPTPHGDPIRYITGKIGNLSVYATTRQVRVKNGSLCKWYLGDNYQSMTRSDIKRAIERLSDTLHLPMDKATITRLDVGLSIPVKQPVGNYLNHLGGLNYAHRLQQPHSLYYYLHRQAERLCFYDKNREQRDHREPVPELYQDYNVLRYEQRYMARLPSLLKVAAVTGAMLYDEEFYISLLKRWRDGYQAIRKINDITLNFQAMKTKKDFDKMCRLAMVERMGGEVEMFAQIAEAQKRGDLTAKQAYDFRKAIKEACALNEGLTIPSECIPELDKKIKEAIMFYR